MLKEFTVKIKTKVPTKEILVQLEILLAEFVERDEDLQIHAEKSKKEDTNRKGKRKTVGTLQTGGKKKRR